MKKHLIRFANCETIAADKMLHFSFTFVFCYIVKIFLAKFNESTIFIIFSLLILSFILSLLKEVFDKYVKKSHFCWIDITAGMIGSGFFILFYLFE